MKIMQINCVYNTGSTGKIVHDIHNSLIEQGIESIVCYGRGKKVNEENVYKTSSELLAKFNNVKSRFTGIQYNGSFFATRKLIGIIKKTQPDVVHLHCINGFFVNIYKLVEYLKKNKIKTVLTLHAEFMHTGSCGHAYDCEKWKTGCGKCPQIAEATKSYFSDRTHECWKRMKSAFEGFDGLYITSVSPWLQSRAEQSPIMSQYKHSSILNAIDCNVFKLKDYTDLKAKIGIKDEKIILYVTSGFKSTIKGAKYVFELAERLKNDNIKFIIIGNNDAGSVEMPSNVIDFGRTENQAKLAEFYSVADLSIITSKRETFSMPVAESLCCGTPIVGPESIAIPEYSEFVEYGDMDALEVAVRKWLNAEYDKEKISQKAIQKYNKKRITEEYIEIYNEV